MLRPTLPLLALLAACGDAAAIDPGTTGTTDALTGGIVPATSTTGTSGEPTPTTGASDTSDNTTGEPATFCNQLDISLVAHPELAIYDPTHRAAFAAYFEQLVVTTGARVRLLANAGTELTLQTDCLLPLGNAKDDPVLVYGEDGVVDPDAPAALDCLLTALDTYTSDFDQGNFYFSGLLFPVLELEQWPAPGASSLAMILAYSDDVQDNIYAQPGLAAEAYLRIVGEQDRRRVATLTYGDVAGKLEIFGLAVSEHSRHYERSKTTLPAALADWTPIARQVCEDFDYQPPFEPLPPPGCKRVDILFAIDNSRSMADKQQVLTLALGDLLSGLANPPCLDENGQLVPVGGPNDACPSGSARQFAPIADIHIGVISSSLGGHGSDACDPSGAGKASNDDKGHLLNRKDPTTTEKVAATPYTYTAGNGGLGYTSTIHWLRIVL